MKTNTIAGLMVLSLLVGSAEIRADAPKMPVPLKEHEWLKQLEGTWETEGEMLTEPGKPAEKFRGSETVRTLGGFWSVTEMKTECQGGEMTGVMTVGYNAEQKKYVGTWVCSMCDHMCKYEGTADDKSLTLYTEAPSPVTGKLVKMKDVVELKGPDSKVLTSSLQTEDGKWVVFLTIQSRRVKK